MESLMRNRARRDIIAEILESSMNGKSKTNIMIEVRLSFYQLNKYLSLNQQAGLLQVSNNSKIKKYTTTEKGIEFLRLYHLLDDLTKH